MLFEVFPYTPHTTLGAGIPSLGAFQRITRYVSWPQLHQTTMIGFLVALLRVNQKAFPDLGQDPSCAGCPGVRPIWSFGNGCLDTSKYTDPCSLEGNAWGM